jgi:hypothetical protein
MDDLFTATMSRAADVETCALCGHPLDAHNVGACPDVPAGHVVVQGADGEWLNVPERWTFDEPTQEWVADISGERRVRVHGTRSAT